MGIEVHVVEGTLNYLSRRRGLGRPQEVVHGVVEKELEPKDAVLVPYMCNPHNGLHQLFVVLLGLGITAELKVSLALVV